MPRYRKKGDPKGKKVIPSVTEIIDDCTSDKHWSIPYGVNQACEWLRLYRLNKKLTEDDIRYKNKDEKEYPKNARYAHKHYSQKALDIGSEVHRLIESSLKYGIDVFKKTLVWDHKTDPQIMNAVNAFWDWAQEHNLKPISLETTVYGDGWAGTLDFYGYFNDKLYVIDWKSSKAHYPSMRYQVAAYRDAKQIEDLEKNGVTFPDFKSKFLPIEQCIQGCGVLRLDKETGLPDWKDTSKTYKSDLAVFHAMVDLYFLRHPKIRKQARGE